MITRREKGMKILSLANQKGGVAKTTTAAVLASGLSLKDYKVLSIDLDPQCNLSIASGADVTDQRKTLYDVFKGTAKIEDVIQKTGMEGSLNVGPLVIAKNRIIPFLIAVCVFAFMLWFLNKTRQGKAIRATSMDKTAAEHVGDGHARNAGLTGPLAETFRQCLITRVGSLGSGILLTPQREGQNQKQ